MCKPIEKNPVSYEFENPISLFSLLNELKQLKYNIKMQILNFQNNVIGLFVTSPDNNLSGYGPCSPSSILKLKNNTIIDYEYIDNPDLWDTYENTVLFLSTLYSKSKKKIPCEPKFKVLENDEIIIGILTITNQFLQITNPTPVINTNDNLIPLRDDNYILTDKKTFLNDTVDTERVEYIKRIKLETNLYTVFRTTIKILLNQYENYKFRREIEQVLENPLISYISKMTTIKTS